MPDPLLQAQDDFFARLLADEYFADVAILKQRDGVTENDITTRLATLNKRGGKLGACVIVLMPECEPKQPNVNPPESDLIQALQVVESPLLNFGASGAGKTAEQIGRRIRQLFHHFYDGGFGTWYLHADSPIDRPKGQVSRGLAFRRHHQDEALAKVATPTVAITGSALPYNVTLACATSGAAILYTVDGTYPRSGEAGTTTYVASFQIAAAATLRVVATKTALQQSDISETAFS